MRLVGLLLAGLLAGPVTAQTPPRCTVVGQMAVSSWLELLGGLSSPEASRLDPVIARLADLTSTYGALGCAPQTLGAAMDCLIEKSALPPRATLRAVAWRNLVWPHLSDTPHGGVFLARPGGVHPAFALGDHAPWRGLTASGGLRGLGAPEFTLLTD